LFTFYQPVFNKKIPVFRGAVWQMLKNPPVNLTVEKYRVFNTINNFFVDVFMLVENC